MFSAILKPIVLNKKRNFFSNRSGNIDEKVCSENVRAVSVDAISKVPFDGECALRIEIEPTEEVVEYMASNLGTDIRQLEGSINRLLAYSTMMCSKINLPLAIEALKDYVNTGYSEKNDVSRIQKVVADYFKVSIEDLKSKKRNAYNW